MSIGFIGGGQMCTCIILFNINKALIGGIIKSNIYLPNNIYVCDRNDYKRKNLSEKYNINTTDNSKSFYDKCDIIIVAVKPKDIPNVMIELNQCDYKDLIISIAAGVSLSKLQSV